MVSEGAENNSKIKLHSNTENNGSYFLTLEGYFHISRGQHHPPGAATSRQWRGQAGWSPKNGLQVNTKIIMPLFTWLFTKGEPESSWRVSKNEQTTARQPTRPTYSSLSHWIPSLDFDIMRMCERGRAETMAVREKENRGTGRGGWQRTEERIRGGEEIRVKSFGKKNINMKERKHEKSSSSLLISGFVNVLSRARVKARLQGALGRVKRKISSKGGNDSHQEVKCFYQNI